MTTLLVAATGGHLAQLHRLAPRLDAVEPERLWVTFDTPQSRSLLASEDKVFVPYVAPRDLPAALRNTRHAARILRDRHIGAAISTGSAIAMSFLPLARARRCPALYIESAARSEGPSLTGRMLERLPGVVLLTQYPGWHRSKWRYVGSVFDEFEPVDTEVRRAETRKLVVTLGTIEGYAFSRLLRHLVRLVPANVEVLWQVGDTPAEGLGIRSVRSLPSADLAEAIAAADVVISHAGIGSALGALEASKCPILVPRMARHHEHVDDHQVQIARELARRGLALHRSVEELCLDDLRLAGSRSARRVGGQMIRTGLLG